MSFEISLPDALRPFLEDEMRELGLASLDACAALLIERARGPEGPSKEFGLNGQTYRLTRLSDSQYGELCRSSIAIEEDAQLAYTLAVSQDRLSLAEKYAVCRHLFGDRGKGFDDWKGAFAFPFALKVPRATRRRAYLFNVMNFRSGVEYTLRKVVEPTDQRLTNPVYYPPDETEFSRADINRFTATFVGYLEGYCESLATRWTERFLLAVESNLILFGFDGEKFFTREFQDPEEFRETRATLAKQLPTPGFYPRAR